MSQTNNNTGILSTEEPVNSGVLSVGHDERVETVSETVHQEETLVPGILNSETSPEIPVITHETQVPTPCNKEIMPVNYETMHFFLGNIIAGKTYILLNPKSANMTAHQLEVIAHMGKKIGELAAALDQVRQLI
jgi:hypothetical protein